MVRRPLIAVCLTAAATVAMSACEGVEDAATDETVGIQQELLALSPGYVVYGTANTCGNAGSAPQVFSRTMVHPLALPPGGTATATWNPQVGRITRGAIEYVSGNGIRLELVTDRCTFVKQVNIGSRVVTPTYDAGYWFSAQASSTQPTDPARYGHNLWVFFPALGDGSTDVVTIVFGRTGGTGTTNSSFTMVKVSAVEASDVNAPVGLSATELHNMFARGLFQKFGPQNSTVITLSDGSTRRVYDYDPSTLQLSVTSGGVGFQFWFKADVENYCDPRVRAYGTFKLKATPADGLAIDWINPAEGNLHWPTGCAILQTLPLIGNVISLMIDDFVRLSLDDAITSNFPDTSQAQLFLNGSTTRTNELLVNIKLPMPSVRIRVPYDAFDLDRGATAFVRGESVMLFGSGLGFSDQAGGISPATTLRGGPNGVPRQGTTPWPNPRFVTRAGALVNNSKAVGQLMARTSSAFVAGHTTYAYEAGCMLTTSPFVYMSPEIRFGVNDTPADAQRLRNGFAPGHDLRLVFVTGTFVASNATPCQGITSGGVYGSGGGSGGGVALP